MQVVILAGGLGTRLSEQTKTVPKALIKIGQEPIIVHLIKFYELHGCNEFLICLGYKGNLIKNFFLENKNQKRFKNLDIKLIKTGQKSFTGERLKRIKKYIKGNFYLTYCDGLSNVNIKKTLQLFNKSKKIALVTAVNPRNRFGVLTIGKNNTVLSFDEKSKNLKTWINGGFFIFSKKIFQYITGHNEILEREPLIKLSQDKQLIAYKHRGFWQCMDTLKDKILLNKIWKKAKNFDLDDKNLL